MYIFLFNGKNTIKEINGGLMMATWKNETEAREQIKAMVKEYYHDFKEKLTGVELTQREKEEIILNIVCWLGRVTTRIHHP